ncbi:MAG: hypothetical protein JWO38_6662 [Gemmataceae bacterium]|nr:hypothetical protein [Gemmataceae bacterium]
MAELKAGRCVMSNGVEPANQTTGGAGEKATPDGEAAELVPGACPPLAPVWPASSLDWSSPRLMVQLYVGNC